MAVPAGADSHSSAPHQGGSVPRRAASLTSRVLTPVIGIIAVSAAGLAWYLSHNTRLQTLDAATASAVATIEQFKALRGYYTLKSSRR